MSSTVWHVLSLRAVNVPMCVCIRGVMLDDTLINTLSGPRALWIPLRKTLHDHLPPLGSIPNDVNTSSHAYTEAYVPPNRFSHKSCVRTRVTHMLHERTHTHMLHEAHRVCEFRLLGNQPVNTAGFHKVLERHSTAQQRH